MNPTDEALTIVRHGLRDEREWLGEETPEQAGYEARHAKPHIVPMLWRARSENA